MSMVDVIEDTRLVREARRDAQQRIRSCLGILLLVLVLPVVAVAAVRQDERAGCGDDVSRGTAAAAGARAEADALQTALARVPCAQGGQRDGFCAVIFFASFFFFFFSSFFSCLVRGCVFGCWCVLVLRVVVGVGLGVALAVGLALRAGAEADWFCGAVRHGL